MMKKTYIQPTLHVVNIKEQQMICGSITGNGDNLNVTIDSGDEGSFDDNTINSRRGSFWDDDEE